MAVAWVLFPLVLVAVCLGCGLAVDWASGRVVSGAMLLPVGLALVIVIATLATSRHATASLATPAVIVLAVAGYALSWPRLRRLRPEPWALGVGIGLFAICAAPLVLSGNATFLGYFVDSDPAFHFVLTTWLLSHGHDLTGLPPVSYSAVANVVREYINTAYPFGADVALGAVRPLVGQDLAWIYQPYLAVMMAFGAVALHELLGGVVESRLLRAACAFIAAQSGLAYAFYLDGSIKEIAAAVLLTVAIVLIVDLLRRPLRVRALAPLAVVAVAGLDVYSVTILAWLGVPLLVFAGIAGWRTRHVFTRGHGWRRALVPAAAVVVVIAIAAPVISGAATFTNVANQVLSRSNDLGNLAAPLKLWNLLGIWPNGDFRFPTLGYTNAYVLMGIALVGAVLGALWMVRNRRRALGPLLLLVTNAIAAVVLLSRSGPYASSKVIMIFSVAGVCTAMLGSLALIDAGRRVEGWVLAVVIGTGVLWTNVLAYHDSSVAPQARFKELAAIDSRFKGKGQAFYDLWDTYAVYFLRDVDVSAPDTFAGPVPQIAGQPVHPIGQLSLPWDPNQLDYSFLQSFPLLILGRSPVVSRPPANYRLAYQGRYYDVWQRTASPTVIRHIPGSAGGVDPDKPARCQAIIATAAAAAREHARLAYVPRASLPTLIPTKAVHPTDWGPVTAGAPDTPADYLSMGQHAGAAADLVRVPRSGRYQVWLAGSVSRPVNIWVGKQFVGSVSDQIGTAGQFVMVGSVNLTAGEQPVMVTGPARTSRPETWSPASCSVRSCWCRATHRRRSARSRRARHDRCAASRSSGSRSCADRGRRRGLTRRGGRRRGLAARVYAPRPAARSSRRRRMAAPVAAGDRFSAMSSRARAPSRAAVSGRS